MREYRKRKRERRMSAPVSHVSSPSIVRAPEPWRVPQRVIERSSPQPTPPNIALELAPTFPFGDARLPSMPVLL